MTIPFLPGTTLIIDGSLILITALLALALIKSKKLARRHQETNSNFVNIIDSANEGIYVTDCDRRFLFWNRAAERITGYRKEDVLGRRCSDNILCHTDRDGNELCFSRCPLNNAVDTGSEHGPEVVYLRHRSGARVPVEVKTAPIRDDRGAITGGVEIFQDVATRIDQERLLRERREKLEAVLDSIGDGILFLDTAGRVSVFNRSSARLFDLGCTVAGRMPHTLPAEAPLRQALAAAESGYRQYAERHPAAAIKNGCGRKDAGFRCWTGRSDTGLSPRHSACPTCMTFRSRRSFLELPRELVWRERTFTVLSSFIELQDTNELWEIVIFRDVSAEKLDAALKVAGAAAHELRQPLQVLMMLAGMSREQHRGPGEGRDYHEMLMKSCYHMEGIIRKMNDLTSYRTKEYIDGAKILDLDHSCGNR